jgi:hypothetical protein
MVRAMRTPSSSSSEQNDKGNGAEKDAGSLTNADGLDLDLLLCMGVIRAVQHFVVQHL